MRRRWTSRSTTRSPAGGAASDAARCWWPVDGEYAATVIEVIGELGLDCQMVRNRAALMVLPAGVTKGTGLGSVLTELNLSAHNTIAVGDAENDLSLFGMAEIGAAVANAVPSVRQHADLVLDEDDGAGVAALLTGPYLSGARRWCPPRRWVEIGTFDDGTPAQIPGSQAGSWSSGHAGSGKSYLVGLMAERWILAGYCVLVIDPEGDHARIAGAQPGARRRCPSVTFPSRRAGDRCYAHTAASCWICQCSPSRRKSWLPASIALGGRSVPRTPRVPTLADLRRGASTRQRRRTARWLRRAGYVLSSFAPASLPADEIDASDVVLELAMPKPLGESPQRTVRRAASWLRACSSVHHRRAPDNTRASPAQVRRCLVAQ